MQHNHLTPYENCLRRAAKAREENKPDIAIQHYTKAIKIQPHPFPFIERGNIYYHQQMTDQAFADYLHAGSFNDSFLSARAYLNCWIICTNQKHLLKVNEATSYLFKAIELDPAIRDFINTEYYDQEIVALTQNINERWVSISEDYLRRGNLYLAKDELSNAYLDANQALELAWFAETSFKARTFCGNLFYAKRHYNRVIVEYKLAFKTSFTNSVTQREGSFTAYQCGCAYQKIKDAGNAIYWFNFALDLNPTLSMAYQALEKLLLNIQTEQELNGIKKLILFEAIKKLPLKEQIKLLEECLDKDSILGQFMWRPRDIKKPCDVGKGTLKKICDHLAKIHPNFVRPLLLSVTTNSIFEVKKIKPEEMILEKKESAIRYQNNL